MAANGKGSAPEETIKVSALANVPAPEGKRSISGWLGLHKEPEAAPAPAAAETPAAAEPANTGSKSTAKTSFDKAAKTSSNKAAKTTSGAAAKDGAKKVTIGPLDKALRAADAQK